MEKSVYKPGILLVATFFVISFALNAQKEVSKDYHKEYTAKKGTTLDLNNRYGNIVIETSATDQVVIDVKVTVRYPNSDRAEKLLSYIDVQFTEDSDRISAKTVFDDKFGFSGWGGDSRKFTINYNVKMPESMNLDLVNRYGDTDLDDLSGQVNLDIKYGDLAASKLTRGNEKPLNTLYLAYGKGTIDEAGWLDATIRYSGNFTLTTGQALLLDTRYSTLHIGKISSVVADSKYDKLNIETINNLVLNSGYADINIETLEKKLGFEGGYGSFSIDKVPAGFESLEVQSKYMGVRMGIDESANYNLNARVSYGSLKFNNDNFQNQKRIIENNSTEVSGMIGKSSNPSSEVKVNSSYGTVKLY
jgi:hypothetical protein